ncbi:fatty acid metabolism regulator protein [Anaerotignum neopropionicum]|uniref:Fatty acid metabolism regulator protein n=1 Tax=Anaerotignum neopropionicum TaxID=36847 RepID=A0A136WCG5_9FIRM|nr:TetR/AcrR family transcriptional regulator [Anaerotignum neopropionicum]KXL52202.1 fatty acid metabolism regulator protein [Anaerotignum neopropionicum]
MPKRTFFNLPDEKKDKIYEAAIHEFSQNHYGKITIDKIVKKAEIPKGSFYQYFQNKNDLYVYLFNQIGNKKKHTLEKAKKYIGKLDFKSYIMLLLEEAGRFEDEDIKLTKLKDKFMNECPQEIRKEILDNEFPKSYRLLTEVINLYIKKGELRENLDIESVAYIITQCMVNIEFYNKNDYRSIIELGERVLDAIMKGIK